MATETSIKVIRHTVREDLAAVFVLLEGAPDLSKEVRLARIDKALAFMSKAAQGLVEARAITEARDDAAHAAAKAAVNETFVAIIESNVEED